MAAWYGLPDGSHRLGRVRGRELPGSRPSRPRTAAGGTRPRTTGATDRATRPADVSDSRERRSRFEPRGWTYSTAMDGGRGPRTVLARQTGLDRPQVVRWSAGSHGDRGGRSLGPPAEVGYSSEGRAGHADVVTWRRAPSAGSGRRRRRRREVAGAIAIAPLAPTDRSWCAAAGARSTGAPYLHRLIQHPG